MLRNITAFNGLAALLLVVNLGAQQPDHPLTKLRKLGLPEAPGSVPVFYIRSAEQRAIRLQKSLEAANSWYEKQLHLQVPMTLAVLDAEMWGKISRVQYPMPHNFFGRGGPGPGLVVLPERMTGQPPPRADRDHAAGGILQGEQILFHEAGHIFADSLKIRSGNEFMNELIAGIFLAAYIGAERPDLTWLLEDARSRQPTPPRYTSLADLDYIYMGVGMGNYFWFQFHLQRLADFLAKDQSFPVVIEKLQAAFPAGRQKQETLDEIDTHLEGIRPGFMKLVGPLAGPTTIPRITPAACLKSSEEGDSRSPVVVRNETADPLIVITPDGRTTRVLAHTWQNYFIVVGASLKLPDGACLVARDEPTLAVIEKQ